MRKGNSFERKGFTLVEALVAVAVLGVSLTPIFAQVNASFRLSRTIQENLTASLLAQEGIELVRGMRDDNWFRSDPFDTNLDSCGGGCRVQYVTSAADCFYGSEPFCLMEQADVPLSVDALGRYQYGNGTETPYKRTVTITQLAPGQYEVVSRVDWDSSGSSRTIEVTGYLFDWLDF